MKSVAEQMKDQVDLYERLDEIPMNESDRQLAKASLRNAEANAEILCALAARVVELTRKIKAAFVKPVRRMFRQSRRRFSRNEG